MSTCTSSPLFEPDVSDTSTLADDRRLVQLQRMELAFAGGGHGRHLLGSWNWLGAYARMRRRTA